MLRALLSIGRIGGVVSFSYILFTGIFLNVTVP